MAQAAPRQEVESIIAARLANIVGAGQDAPISKWFLLSTLELYFRQFFLSYGPSVRLVAAHQQIRPAVGPNNNGQGLRDQFGRQVVQDGRRGNKAAFILGGTLTAAHSDRVRVVVNMTTPLNYEAAQTLLDEARRHLSECLWEINTGLDDAHGHDTMIGIVIHRNTVYFHSPPVEVNGARAPQYPDFGDALNFPQGAGGQPLVHQGLAFHSQIFYDFCAIQARR
jgi:hypothetical protein